MGYGGPIQEISEGNNISNWARDPFCDFFFSKNAAVFCLCPENLLRDKLKSTGLVSLSEFSRQTNLDCSMVISISLGLVFNEKEQVGQKEKTKCTV